MITSCGHVMRRDDEDISLSLELLNQLLDI